MADTTSPTAPAPTIATPLSMQSLMQMMQMLQPASGGAQYGDEGSGADRQVDVNRTLIDRELPASSRALSMIAEKRGRIY